MKPLYLVPPPAYAGPEFEARPVATPGVCPRCEGSEWIIHGMTTTPCECRVARVARERTAAAIAALPPTVRRYTRAAWNGSWPQQAERLDRWPSAGPDGIVRPWAVVITGATPGTGKTHMGTALYLAALPRLANPAAALWVSAAGAHRMIGEEIQTRMADDRDDPAYRRDTKRAMHEAPLLLLDDVGREAKPTPASVALIVSVLMHRHAHCLPTILPTNFATPKGFHAYDPALTSRLSEDTVVIDRSGLPDYRPTIRPA